MRLRWYCHFGALNGFGRAARDYLLALHQVDDVELEIAVLGEQLTSPEPRYSALDPLAVPHDRVVGTPDVAIYHTTLRVLEAVRWPEDAPTKCVALTAWETSHLPTKSVDALSGFDAVIVPSGFCADVMGGSSSRTPITGEPLQIYVVPHCFDETFWPLVPHERHPDTPYRFYSISAWGERKNNLGVLRAYLHEFSSVDRVQLMLIIANPDLDEIRSVIALSRIPAAELPQISIPGDVRLNEQELVDLHVGGDCYVTATRGEGWGLGMFEAATMGKHVVAPAYGGHTDFLEHYPLWHQVPHQMTPCFGSEGKRVVEQRDGQNVAVSRVQMAAGMDCKQLWAEPDLAVMARWMRRLYNYTGPRPHEEARADRAALEARFGYKVVGPQLANLLRGIAWQSPTHSTP